MQRTSQDEWHSLHGSVQDWVTRKPISFIYLPCISMLYQSISCDHPPLQAISIAFNRLQYQGIPTLDNRITSDPTGASAASASWIQRPQERVSNSKAKGVPCDVVQFLKGHASWRWDAGWLWVAGWLVFYWDDFGDQRILGSHMDWRWKKVINVISHKHVISIESLQALKVETRLAGKSACSRGAWLDYRRNSHGFTVQERKKKHINPENHGKSTMPLLL